MGRILAALLIASQVAVAPAGAATIEPIGDTQARTGAFAGARVRIAFGGRESGALRAGLGIGPTRIVQGGDGRVRTSFGEGLEFGSRAGGQAQLSIAGRSMNDWRLQADGKGGVPTWALVAGGVVVVVGIAGAVFLDYLGDQSE